jgi:hypothetical protein
VSALLPTLEGTLALLFSVQVGRMAEEPQDVPLPANFGE